MSDSSFLYNLWYIAAPGIQVPKGATLAKTILGQDVLLGRDKNGMVFALRDFCPHRGIPLRYGKFDGENVECCYHGWCFNTAGQCTKIPSLLPDDTTDISRIKTPSGYSFHRPKPNLPSSYRMCHRLPWPCVQGISTSIR